MKKMIYWFLLVVMLLVALPQSASAASLNRNVVMLGSRVHIAPGESVENVFVLGSDAIIDGQVRHNVVVIGGNIHVSAGGRIEHNAAAIGGSITNNGGHIGHQNVSLGLGRVSVNRGSAVPSIPPIPRVPAMPRVPRPPRFTSYNGGWFNTTLPFGLSLGRLFWAVLFGWLLYALLPRHTRTVAGAVEQDALKSVLWGLLGYLAFIPALILLIITIVGIPLVPVLFLALSVGRLLGQAALGMLAGTWLSRQLNTKFSEAGYVVLGLAGLGLVAILPVIGSLASLFYSLVGFGAVIYTRFGARALQTA